MISLLGKGHVQRNAPRSGARAADRSIPNWRGRSRRTSRRGQFPDRSNHWHSGCSLVGSVVIDEVKRSGPRSPSARERAAWGSSHGCSRVAARHLERVEALPNSLHRIGEILGQHPRDRARHEAVKDDPALRHADVYVARGVELLVEQAHDLVSDGGVVPADDVRRRGAELRRPPIDAYGGVGLGWAGLHGQRHRARPPAALDASLASEAAGGGRTGFPVESGSGVVIAVEHVERRCKPRTEPDRRRAHARARATPARSLRRRAWGT